jgi:hypothetical protein
MPSHIHVVIRPMAGFELEDGLQRIKQYGSTHVNIGLKQPGPLWQAESYDRIVRDEETRNHRQGLQARRRSELRNVRKQ